MQALRYHSLERMAFLAGSVDVSRFGLGWEKQLVPLFRRGISDSGGLHPTYGTGFSRRMTSGALLVGSVNLLCRLLKCHAAMLEG